MSGKSGTKAAPALSISRRDGFTVYAAEDNAEWLRIMDAYLAAGVTFEAVQDGGARGREFAVTHGGEEFRFKALSRGNPGRLVFRAESGGKSYVLKWTNRKTLGLYRLLPGIPGVTYYTRLLRKVSRAVANGCDVTQNYYLVAERPRSLFRMDVLILMEYVEGQSMGRQEDFAPFRERLEKTVAGLVRHGLTLDDLSPFNFLLAGDAIKAIDLSCRPPTRLNAVKMIMKMNVRYGLRLPIEGLANKAVRALLGMRYAVRGWFGKKDF